MFNKILNQLQTQYNTQINKFTTTPIQKGVPYIHTKVQKEFVQNPTAITIHGFYPTIISNLPKEYFSHSFIPQAIKELIKNKEYTKFINSIYGYINNSDLKSNKNIHEIVTDKATTFLSPLFLADNAIYVDTDMILFNSPLTQDQLDYITNSPYSFLITNHNLAAIFKKKQILIK